MMHSYQLVVAVFALSILAGGLIAVVLAWWSDRYLRRRFREFDERERLRR